MMLEVKIMIISGSTVNDLDAKKVGFFWLVIFSVLILVVQFSSVAQSRPTLCNPMDCSMPASLSVTNSWSLLKLMSIESVMSSNHLILCRPLLLLPSIFPSIRVFSKDSVLRIRCQSIEVSASASVLPMNIQD